jgi:hypothetical protein
MTGTTTGGSAVNNAVGGNGNDDVSIQVRDEMIKIFQSLCDNQIVNMQDIPRQVYKLNNYSSFLYLKDDASVCFQNESYRHVWPIFLQQFQTAEYKAEVD